MTITEPSDRKQAATMSDEVGVAKHSAVTLDVHLLGTHSCGVRTPSGRNKYDILVIPVFQIMTCRSISR
jgi:hypothetical protein